MQIFRISKKHFKRDLYDLQGEIIRSSVCWWTQKEQRLNFVIIQF